MQSGEGLVVSDLSIERSGRPLLAHLSVTLAPGRALAVMGENGVGKSTLLRGLAGLFPASAGEVRLRLGTDDDAPLSERVHYLGHGNGLKAGLTAEANLVFRHRWGSGGSGAADAARSALVAMGLAHCADIPAGLLSAGQKRRVALAALLVTQRPLWLLDEPATALDRDAEASLSRLLEAHLAGGGLAVLALHAPLALPMATLRLGRA